MSQDISYYSIVTFGSPSYGTRRGHYRSLDRAIADAETLGGGSCSTVRIVECTSQREARDADISDSYPVRWQA